MLTISMLSIRLLSGLQINTFGPTPQFNILRTPGLMGGNIIHCTASALSIPKQQFLFPTLPIANASGRFLIIAAGIYYGRFIDFKSNSF
jgi:hypothetical protein